jgi:AcrR family transcriptional regulator
MAGHGRGKAMVDGAENGRATGAERRTFRREPAPRRREEMIRAALDLIRDSGLEAATVRAIAERANVTPGLIRHHFNSKEDLILAAYDHHMTRMTEASFGIAGGDGRVPASARLARFVGASLDAPVADAAAVTLWAAFISRLRHDPRMRAIHARTYRDFRDRLETLIAAALAEADRPVDAASSRRLAIASNGVIDGLWLEAGALPEAFVEGELAAIGRAAVGAIVGLELDPGHASEGKLP